MKDSGMTLIELLMVISVTSILIFSLGFQFTGWIGRYGVESEVKEFYSDLMNARSRAMKRKRTHFVSLLDSSAYTVYEDDSDGTNKTPDGNGVFNPGSGAGADTELTQFPKTVGYEIRWNENDINAPVNLAFNSRGLSNTLGTISIFVDRNNDNKPDFSPDYSCIVIFTTRINLGKWDDNTNECVQK